MQHICVVVVVVVAAAAAAGPQGDCSVATSGPGSSWIW